MDAVARLLSLAQATPGDDDDYDEDYDDDDDDYDVSDANVANVEPLPSRSNVVSLLSSVACQLAKASLDTDLSYIDKLRAILGCEGGRKRNVAYMQAWDDAQWAQARKKRRRVEQVEYEEVVSSDDDDRVCDASDTSDTSDSDDSNDSRFDNMLDPTPAEFDQRAQGRVFDRQMSSVVMKPWEDDIIWEEPEGPAVARMDIYAVNQSKMMNVVPTDWLDYISWDEPVNPTGLVIDLPKLPPKFHPPKVATVWDDEVGINIPVSNLMMQLPPRVVRQVGVIAASAHDAVQVARPVFWNANVHNQVVASRNSDTRFLVRMYMEHNPLLRMGAGSYSTVIAFNRMNDTMQMPQKQVILRPDDPEPFLYGGIAPGRSMHVVRTDDFTAPLAPLGPLGALGQLFIVRKCPKGPGYRIHRLSAVERVGQLQPTPIFLRGLDDAKLPMLPSSQAAAKALSFTYDRALNANIRKALAAKVVPAWLHQPWATPLVHAYISLPWNVLMNIKRSVVPLPGNKLSQLDTKSAFTSPDPHIISFTHLAHNKFEANGAVRSKDRDSGLQYTDADARKLKISEMTALLHQAGFSSAQLPTGKNRRWEMVDMIIDNADKHPSLNKYKRKRYVSESDRRKMWLDSLVDTVGVQVESMAQRAQQAKVKGEVKPAKAKVQPVSTRVELVESNGIRIRRTTQIFKTVYAKHVPTGKRFSSPALIQEIQTRQRARPTATT